MLRRFAMPAAMFLAVVLAGPLTATEIVFEDVTGQVGLDKLVGNWTLGHGAAWGDADGSGRPDLFIGAFADREIPWRRPDAPLPNMLLINGPDGFSLSAERSFSYAGRAVRTTGVIFVDLNNNGRLDLVVSNHFNRAGAIFSGVFENLGDGRFRDVTDRAGPAWPRNVGTRNVTALDIDNDGLLDLIFADGTYGNKPTRRLIVLRNRGNFQFEDISARLNLPVGDSDHLGLAVGDVNGDGVMDIFVAGPNHLLLGQADGTFRHVLAGQFPRYEGREGFTCGAVFGDLTGDGQLDLVTAEHAGPSQFYVHINEGVGRDGVPRFRNATQQVGLGQAVPPQGRTGLTLRGAHVQIVDLDNDGRRDILTAMVWETPDGRIQPVALRNLSPRGVPRFRWPAMDRMVGYYAAAPMADFDRDGRMDIFLATWGQFRRESRDSMTIDIPSYMFRNVTHGGNWLMVRVAGDGKTRNTMGIGSTVRVYKAGGAGDQAQLLGRCDIVIGTGYSSGEEAIAHFGLADEWTVDVVITWGTETRTVTGVSANQYLTVPWE